MDYYHLFTKFNMSTARQACLNAKVSMRTEYCLSERKRLEFECKKQADLLKVRDAKIKSLKAQLLLKETEAAKAVHLRAHVSASKTVKKMHASEIDALQQKNVALENEKGSLDVKVAELLSSVSTKDLELKELNIVVSSLRFQKDGLVGQVHELEATCYGLRSRWLLTYGPKLAFVKCLNSREYLSALGAAISHAIKKGMQDGLSAGIDHGKASSNLGMSSPITCLWKCYGFAPRPLVDAPGMSDLQPNIEQLKLPIHCPKDQVVLGETSLLVALDVTHSRIKRIKENVAAQHMPTTAATTTTLSVTFTSASTVPPITIEDYEIIGIDGLKGDQGSGHREAASFQIQLSLKKRPRPCVAFLQWFLYFDKLFIRL
nr:hypothetical protein [Tanacetum cinerariifolium]